MSRVLVILLAFLTVLLIVSQFDKNIFSISEVELIQINQRQQYFNLELGKIYGNRFGIYYFDNLRPVFNKISLNFFSDLTPIFILCFFLILVYVKFKSLSDVGSKNYFWILILILVIAAFLRFYKLNDIPAGLHADAASQGFNAFSLIHTGKDRYGESFPLLFRSNGSYQPPIYTYLTTIPVLIFGNTPFSARFLSAISGVLLVLITYLLLPKKVSLTGAFIVAISPWSVFFSRLTVEANMAVTVFAFSVLMFMISLRKKYIFIPACLILGLSTHIYYSERLISVIFLPVFIFVFRSVLFKKWVTLGLIVFAITQIPHLFMLQTGAFANRFSQAGSTLSINNYLTYFSPNNLFFDSGANLGRLMPNLGVFYSWMILPFLIGLAGLLKRIEEGWIKILGIVLFITPIPAGLTGDVFYPLRTLDFLWVITLIISIGIYKILTLINLRKSKIVFIILITFYSLSSLYISYFVLFKYEKSNDYGYVYIKLMDKLEGYKDKHIVIDSARDSGVGLRLAYLKSYDPSKIQQQLTLQRRTPYYNSIVNTNEIYNIYNIEVKPLDWAETGRKNYIFCGDKLAISDKNVLEHKLKLEFGISDLGDLTENYLLCYSSPS